MSAAEASSDPQFRRRRVRYSGKYPRNFSDKYKEHQPENHPDIIAKILASGRTPAGAHVSIMVDEILETLQPRPGHRVADLTLGYGGHARAVLQRIRPGGALIGFDVDPIELPKTEARLRQEGFDETEFIVRKGNFAGLTKALAEHGWDGVDLIIADLGVSSMQLDNPERGFSVKADGPLDMRMNPGKGQSVSQLLAKINERDLTDILQKFSDEPCAAVLAKVLAGQKLETTAELRQRVIDNLRMLSSAEQKQTIRRVFQALRIAVNEELSALDHLLRILPGALCPGGRAAILTFHSGEDRRVKRAFADGCSRGIYTKSNPELIRPSAQEIRANPRARAAKLRWVQKCPDQIPAVCGVPYPDGAGG